MASLGSSKVDDEVTAPERIANRGDHPGIVVQAMAEPEVTIHIVDLDEVLDRTSQHPPLHERPSVSIIEQSDQRFADVAGKLIFERRATFHRILDRSHMAPHAITIAQQVLDPPCLA